MAWGFTRAVGLPADAAGAAATARGQPRHAGARPPIVRPEDCLKYPLLQDSDRADWPLWLQAHGVDARKEAQRGPSYEDDLLLLPPRGRASR